MFFAECVNIGGASGLLMQLVSIPVTEQLQSFTGIFRFTELKSCPIPRGMKWVTSFLLWPCSVKRCAAHMVVSRVMLRQLQERTVCGTCFPSTLLMHSGWKPSWPRGLLLPLRGAPCVWKG